MLHSFFYINMYFEKFCGKYSVLYMIATLGEFALIRSYTVCIANLILFTVEKKCYNGKNSLARSRCLDGRVQSDQKHS